MVLEGIWDRQPKKCLEKISNIFLHFSAAKFTKSWQQISMLVLFSTQPLRLTKIILNTVCKVRFFQFSAHFSFLTFWGPIYSGLLTLHYKWGRDQRTFWKLTMLWWKLKKMRQTLVRKNFNLLSEKLREQFVGRNYICLF